MVYLFAASMGDFSRWTSVDTSGKNGRGRQKSRYTIIQRVETKVEPRVSPVLNYWVEWRTKIFYTNEKLDMFWIAFSSNLRE